MSFDQKLQTAPGGRIAMADDGPLSDRQREVHKKIIAGKRKKIIGPLRVALHSPELADRWQAFGEYLRFDTGLPKQLSELVIVMTGRYWNCQVEWVIHARIAADAGLASDVIEAIRTARAPEFDDAQQRAVYEFTRELLAYAQVSDETYKELLREIGVDALVELTALVGYYSMVAMTLNAHDVPVPDEETGTRLDLPVGGGLMAPSGLPTSTKSEA